MPSELSDIEVLEMTKRILCEGTRVDENSYLDEKAGWIVGMLARVDQTHLPFIRDPSPRELEIVAALKGINHKLREIQRANWS